MIRALIAAAAVEGGGRGRVLDSDGIASLCAVSELGVIVGDESIAQTVPHVCRTQCVSQLVGSVRSTR